MMSAHYQALQVNHEIANHAARNEAFEAEFGDWITAQNAWGQFKSALTHCPGSR